MTTEYQIDLPVFQGPLDLLLHLIDREELDITAISLAKVTAQYLAQVEEMKQGKIEHLIDFIVVGARLVLIKSRALLPKPEVIPSDYEDEEDPAATLIRQLKQYKRFKRAARWLQRREELGLRTYLRVVPPPRPVIETKLDLTGITPQTLHLAMQAILNRAETAKQSVSVVERRHITIEGQLKHVRRRLKAHSRLAFQSLLSSQPNQEEVSITLLALLELMKRNEIMAEQPYLFGPIEVASLPTDAEQPV